MVLPNNFKDSPEVQNIIKSISEIRRCVCGGGGLIVNEMRSFFQTCFRLFETSLSLFNILSDSSKTIPGLNGTT